MASWLIFLTLEVAVTQSQTLCLDARCTLVHCTTDRAQQRWGDATMMSAKGKAVQPARTGNVLWWLQPPMSTLIWTDLRFPQMSVSSSPQWTPAATCLASTGVCAWDMARTATNVTALALATMEKTAPSVSPWMCLSYPLGTYCFWRNLKYSFCS